MFGLVLGLGVLPVLSQAAEPPQPDLHRRRAQGAVWKGIYAVDNGTVRICDNAPDLARGRPTAFEAPAGSGYVLITFERTRP